MSFLIDYTFTDPLNYTYDTNKVEFSAGKARLKDLRPANATFYGNYNTSINGTWGDGVLTGTGVGGASVITGYLDLAHNDKRYVNYDAINNADSLQVGTIRFKYIPNFIIPVGEHYIFTICKEYNSLVNLIAYRDTGSHHRLHIYDSAGILIEECYFGYKQWTAGQEYEIEFDYDITVGEIRMFIDGAQFGTTKTSTGIRDPYISLFRIGCNYQDSTNSNFKINDFIIYNTVQHTANYIPDWHGIPATIYDTNNPEIITNSSFRHKGLEDFVETATIAGSDNIKYQLSKNGIWYYYNGSHWAVSDGSYIQSNTALEILANKSSFVSDITTTQIKNMLHSTNGFTTPEIDNLRIEYDYAGETPDIIEKCVVWGYMLEAIGVEAKNSKIEIYLQYDAVKYKLYTTIRKVIHTIYPKSTDGYWEVDLAECTNMTGPASETDVKYIFDFGGKIRFEKTVPNEVHKCFYDLL